METGVDGVGVAEGAEDGLVVLDSDDEFDGTVELDLVIVTFDLVAKGVRLIEPSANSSSVFQIRTAESSLEENAETVYVTLTSVFEPRGDKTKRPGDARENNSDESLERENESVASLAGESLITVATVSVIEEF